MNSIVGILFMIGLDSYQVYSVSRYLFNDLNMCSFYENRFAKTYKYVEAAKKLIEIYIPKLHEIMEKLQIKVEMVAIKWFLTCFSDFLSKKEFISVIVNIINYGLSFVCCLTYAFFFQLREELCKATDDDDVYFLL